MSARKAARDFAPRGCTARRSGCPRRDSTVHAGADASTADAGWNDAGWNDASGSTARCERFHGLIGIRRGA